jgi:phosphoglycolate phosphatase
VFDLDGTLIDSSPGIAAALSIAFLSAGRTMPTTNVRSIIGPPIRVIATRIEPTLTEGELAQVEKTYRSEYDTEGWRETVLFEGVVKTLQDIRDGGTRMFVVTNKPKIPTTKILTYLGMGDLFDDVVTRDSRNPGYGSKSEMLRDLILRHNLHSESTIMVGDTAEDGEAAAANDLSFIHATYGYGSMDAPHCRIASFPELRTVLSTKNPGRRA